MEAFQTEASLWYRNVKDGPETGTVGCSTPGGEMSIAVHKTNKRWKVTQGQVNVDDVVEFMLESFLDSTPHPEGTDLLVSRLTVYDTHAPSLDESTWIVQIDYYELPVWRLEELERRIAGPLKTTSASTQTRIEPVTV